jgi:hypothetical protein
MLWCGNAIIFTVGCFTYRVQYSNPILLFPLPFLWVLQSMMNLGLFHDCSSLVLSIQLQSFGSTGTDEFDNKLCLSFFLFLSMMNRNMALELI